MLMVTTKINLADMEKEALDTQREVSYLISEYARLKRDLLELAGSDPHNPFSQNIRELPTAENVTKALRGIYMKVYHLRYAIEALNNMVSPKEEGESNGTGD